MYGRLQKRGLALAAAFLVLALPRALGAPPAPDTAALDRQIADTLKDVHNRGADLFNAGDAAGCYRVFQGLLWTVRPLLGHHPDLQKQIDDGMARAEGLQAVNRRALALHEVIESVRGKLAPARKTEGKMPEAKGPEPGPKSEQPAGTLWDRLGREENVRRIIDSFVTTASLDPKVNFSRNRSYDAKKIADLKTHLVEFLSQATGGPLKYHGKSMKEVHKGMKITDAEFDLAEVHLRNALMRNRVKLDDVKAVLEAVEGTRKDIVEVPAAKPGEKKPETKGK